MATALVTGVTGQLGYYVASELAARGDTVVGLVRQSTVGRDANAQALPYRPVTGDLLDEYSLLSILEEVRPDRIFNFGAQSFIPASWTQPILTAQYTALGVVRLLEAARRAVPKCRILQAGSSELFAGAERSPQDEQVPIRPANPYGIAKAFAFDTVRAYRRQYQQYATNAIFISSTRPTPSSSPTNPCGAPASSCSGRLRGQWRRSSRASGRLFLWATWIRFATGGTRRNTRLCRLR
jgi:GDPmannose 4,6-dehydratase